MKKKNLQDERIITQRLKITSEAYGIFMIVLLASILIQQYLFNAQFEQYAAEFICLLGMSVYVIIRNFMFGLNIFGEGERVKYIPLINSLVSGIILTVVNGILNYKKYTEHYEDNIGLFIVMLIITFISSTVTIFIILSCLNYLNKKKQASIQKQLDKDEQNE